MLHSSPLTMSQASPTLFDFISPAQRDRVLGRCGLSHRLPRHVYSDPGFLRLEYEGWLSRTWLMVGRAHEIPEPGDAAPVPGHPIFLIRDVDGEIRAFYNSCRHRGHELISEPCSRRQGIVCPYHHWVYHTTGELRTATHFSGYRKHGHPELDPQAYGLKAIRTGVWHNWVLVNLDGRAPPLEEFVAPLADYYRDVAFPLARHFSTVFRHPFPANWKTVTENNIEPYHVPMVHPGTTAGHPFDSHRIVDEGPLVGCAVDIEGSTFTNRPPPQTADHLDGSGRFILRVPNLYIAAHAPDKLVDSLILPDWEDPMKCWVSHACYTTSEPGMNDDALGRWAAIQETVMEEDAAVMEGVVRGFRAPVMDDGGVISPAWEKCVSGFYRALLRALENQEFI